MNKCSYCQKVPIQSLNMYGIFVCNEEPCNTIGLQRTCPMCFKEKILYRFNDDDFICQDCIMLSIRAEANLKKICSICKVEKILDSQRNDIKCCKDCVFKLL